MSSLSTMDIFELGGKITEDPASLGWPPTLPIEIALKTAPMDTIRESYGYSHEEWQALKHDPVFLKDLTQAVETVKQDGMSFKLKAKLQAEEILKTSWRLIHAPADEVPPSVKADLIKATMRWAGYDQKDSNAGQALANALQINIQL